MPRKVLILMSDTGGGHRSAAEAISEAMAERYGGEAEISIVDAWKHHTPFPVNRIGGSYPWLASEGRWLWKLLWEVGESRRRASLLGPVGGRLTRRPLVALLRREAPDVVASVHSLIVYAPLYVMRKTGIKVPFVTVVTDLVSAPAAWFCPEADLCIVPTEPARERAIRFGMPPEKIEVLGLPVGLKFTRSLLAKEDLRDRLGLERDRPTLLVVGGAEGMGRVFDIARAIAGSGAELQMMIVAGRNRELQQRLEAVRWEVPTRVYGFVTNMPELMGAADAIVTKAGPGTISEALIVGLPIILSGYVPGQEDGNITYVVDNGLGTFAEEPERIAAIVQDWLRPGNPALVEMAGRARRLGRPNAAFEIAGRILDMAVRN